MSFYKKLRQYLAEMTSWGTHWLLLWDGLLSPGPTSPAWLAELSMAIVLLQSHQLLHMDSCGPSCEIMNSREDLYIWPSKTATSTEGKRQLSNSGYFDRESEQRGVKGRSRQTLSCFKHGSNLREQKLKLDHGSSLGYWWLDSPCGKAGPAHAHTTSTQESSPSYKVQKCTRVLRQTWKGSSLENADSLVICLISFMIHHCDSLNMGVLIM